MGGGTGTIPITIPCTLKPFYVLTRTWFYSVSISMSVRASMLVHQEPGVRITKVVTRATVHWGTGGTPMAGRLVWTSTNVQLTPARRERSVSMGWITSHVLVHPGHGGTPTAEVLNASVSRILVAYWQIYSFVGNNYSMIASILNNVFPSFVKQIL